MYQKTWRQFNPIYNVPIEIMKYKKDNWLNRHWIIMLIIMFSILITVAALFPYGI